MEKTIDFSISRYNKDDYKRIVCVKNNGITTIPEPRILCVDKEGGNPIVALIKEGESELIFTFDENGTCDTICGKYILKMEVHCESPMGLKTYDSVLVRNEDGENWNIDAFIGYFIKIVSSLC